LTLAGATACALPTWTAWPAVGAAGPPLRVVFFTDVHARTEWETPRATQMAAAAINARRPELVIAGGDLITDGFQSAAATVAPRWEVYLEMHRAIDGRVEPVIGNHDLVAAIPENGTPPAADPREPFRKAFDLERTYRSFGLRGYHFLLLDSIAVVGGEHKYRGHVDERQLTWLKTELESIPRETPVVMATHLPLLTAMYQATEGATESALPNRVVENNREVLELFDNHNLLLVLQGHLHVDEMIRWRNTTFVTGGAVSGKWWRGSWHGTSEGFGELTLRPDRVEWQYHTYGWTARRP
jgi:3',5'-cyclic AMP phosphodiesterase CpdA